MARNDYGTGVVRSRSSIRKNAAAAGLWKKPVRGKRGKPKAGFPLSPPPLESRTTRGIPLFPQPRLLLVSHEPNNLFLITKVGVGPNETIERGQIKLTEPATMKARRPSLKQVQAVRCPTCGVGPGEKCQLTTGQPRKEPHRERRLLASE